MTEPACPPETDASAADFEMKVHCRYLLPGYPYSGQYQETEYPCRVKRHTWLPGWLESLTVMTLISYKYWEWPYLERHHTQATSQQFVYVNMQMRPDKVTFDIQIVVKSWPWQRPKEEDPQLQTVYQINDVIELPSGSNFSTEWLELDPDMEHASTCKIKITSLTYRTKPRLNKIPPPPE